MGLVHFNMATFVGGCGTSNWVNLSSKPETFAPSNLDTDQWAVSMQALGIREAVLTAKHGCWFAIWPTTAKLPDGRPYGYSVGADLDVLGRFSDSMRHHGIGHGFYYSLTDNFYLNVCNRVAGACEKSPLPGQVPVTQAEFEAIAEEQVTELWTKYGNLTEIWFDGGYTSDMKSRLLALLARTQPKAVGFNGGGISSSAARWVGTEGDMAPQYYPNGVWSTYCCNSTGPDEPCVVAHSNACSLNDQSSPYGGAGCPATGEEKDGKCNLFYPAAVDYTLQANDVWFWMPPPQELRNLSELINVYHNSVGRNTVMELAFSIDRTGRVDPTHAALYAAFGGWIKNCYGSPVAEAGSFGPAGPSGPWTLSLDVGSVPVDRVVIREDQSLGQRILAYGISVIFPNGTTFVFSNGTSVGNKRIDLLGGAAAPVTVTGTLLFQVFKTALNLPPLLKSFAAFRPCPTGTPGTKPQMEETGGRELII